MILEIMLTVSGDQIEIATFPALRRANSSINDTKLIFLNTSHSIDLECQTVQPLLSNDGAQRTFDQFQVGKGALATAVGYHHT